MSGERQSVGWRLPVLLAMVLVGIILGRDWLLRESSSTNEPLANKSNSTSSSGQTVSLVLDFGDEGAKQIGDLPYQDGMTVRELMLAAQQNNASVRFTQRGSGAAAMLIELGGVANQGGDGRNWLYWINDELAHVSFEVYELKPGDRVLWKFVENE